MKKIILTGLIVSLPFASVLNNIKDEIFNAEINKTKEDTNALKNDWISPIRININYTKNTQDKISTDTKSIQIVWNQDIFRSGGIFYAIKYAKALGIYNLDLIKQQKLNLIKQIFSLKTQILRDKLLLQQNKLKLANLEINVKVTKANYLAGNADISDMNNILVQRDNQKMAILSLKQSIQDEIRDLKKLTNKNFEIKKFPLISKEQYINQNIAIKTLNDKSKSDYTKTKITIASYLPKLTTNIQASHDIYDSEIDKQDNIDNPWSVGLTLSMPLDINYKANVESSKISYLKSKFDIIDKENELSQKYDEVIDNINILKEKIKVAKEIQNSYKNLYDIVKKQFKVGLKNEYDVESLKNSLEIQNLEIKIQQYNILLQKIDLYFDAKE